MRVIRANCRAQFTPADMAFIGSVVPSSGKHDSRWLFKVLQEPESMDRVLDHPKLFRGLLDYRNCVSISLHLYFYVLVRHSLLREDIRDREVADYVAELLAVFASQPRWRKPLASEPRSLDYFHDMMAVLDRTDGDRHFEMLTHIGNHALFMAGLFPAHVEKRVERRGAPGFRFFEEMGSAHYRRAGGHHLAKKMDLDSVFLTLGQVFPITRLALNRLSEKLVFLKTERAVQDLFREIDSH